MTMTSVTEDPMLVTNIPSDRLTSAQARLDRIDADAFAARVLRELVDVACRGALDLDRTVGHDHSAAPYIRKALDDVRQIMAGLGASAIVAKHAEQIKAKDAEIARLRSIVGGA